MLPHALTCAVAYTSGEETGILYSRNGGYDDMLSLSSKEMERNRAENYFIYYFAVSGRTVVEGNAKMSCNTRCRFRAPHQLRPNRGANCWHL